MFGFLRKQAGSKAQVHFRTDQVGVVQFPDVGVHHDPERLSFVSCAKPLLIVVRAPAICQKLIIFREDVGNRMQGGIGFVQCKIHLAQVREFVKHRTISTHQACAHVEGIAPVAI